MAINGRTFQILYILRELAQQTGDLTLGHGDWDGASCSDISDFIARRRNMAPNIYDKAYISPSALETMVGRMASREGLLECHGLTYTATVKGSAMADLLTDIDACSTRFLDNYKPEVCIAALRQSVRLGNTDGLDARQVSAVSGISLDSARRGLAALVEQGLVTEHPDGRSSTYTVTDSPAESDDTDEDDEALVAAAQKGLDLAKAPLPDWASAKPVVTFDDDETDRIVDSVLNSGKTVLDAGAAGTLVTNPDDPSTSMVNLSGSPNLTLVTEQLVVDDAEALGWDPSNDLPEQVAGDPDALYHDYSSIPAELDNELAALDRERDCSSEDDAVKAGNPFEEEWASVREEVMEAVIQQARVSGLSLDEFLAYTVQTNQDRIQRALFQTA